MPKTTVHGGPSDARDINPSAAPAVKEETAEEVVPAATEGSETPSAGTSSSASTRKTPSTTASKKASPRPRARTTESRSSKDRGASSSAGTTDTSGRATADFDKE